MAPWWLSSSKQEKPAVEEPAQGEAEAAVDDLEDDEEPFEIGWEEDDDSPEGRTELDDEADDDGEDEDAEAEDDEAEVENDEAGAEDDEAEDADSDDSDDSDEDDSQDSDSEEEDAGAETGAPSREEREPARPRRRRRSRRRRRRIAAEDEAEPAAEAPTRARSERKSEPPKRVPPPAEDEDDGRDRGVEALAKELFFALPERAPSAESDERKIAMFCDLENIALGVRESEVKKLEFQLILERLLEKGKIIVKKAYADWQRYSHYKRLFHEAAIELIDIPQKRYSGKNSADIKLVVDAMDLCYSKEHLDTFVIVSGDSDFSPLVSKLKENNKYVIGIGLKSSSSSLLVGNCDEFIYYEDIWRAAQSLPRLDRLSPEDAELFGLMIDAILALVRESKEVLWPSMVKQTMQRKRPSFSESHYGYKTFSELLEDAERKKVIRLKRDQRSGSYIIKGFA